MKRRIFFGMILLLIVVGGVFVNNHVYKSHRDIASELPFAELSATNLGKFFVEDPANASQTYLNKTLQISGVITEMDKVSCTLNNLVICYADSLVMSSLEMNDEVVLKGRCIGYDELLEQVKIDQIIKIQP